MPLHLILSSSTYLQAGEMNLQTKKKKRKEKEKAGKV
jgi:hypothetical protein